MVVHCYFSVVAFPAHAAATHFASMGGSVACLLHTQLLWEVAMPVAIVLLFRPLASPRHDIYTTISQSYHLTRRPEPRTILIYFPDALSFILVLSNVMFPASQRNVSMSHTPLHNHTDAALPDCFPYLDAAKDRCPLLLMLVTLRSEVPDTAIQSSLHIDRSPFCLCYMLHSLLL